MITIDLPGTPIPKGRPRFGQGRAYTPKRTAAYAKSLAWAAKVAMKGRKPLEGPLAVFIEAYFQGEPGKAHVSRPDVDNLAKMIDSLNGIVWGDDCQICELNIYKRYAETAMLTITVHELETP